MAGPRRVLHRLVVVAAGAAVSLVFAGAVSGATSGPTTVVVPPSQVPAVLTEAGIQPPPCTCVGYPALPGCPPVTEVVVQLPTQWDSASASPSLSPSTDSSTGYGPAVAPSSSATVTPDATTFEDACAIHATTPALTYFGGLAFVVGTADNVCQVGVGVTSMEVFSTLQRYTSASGWVGYATCDNTKSGAGELSCTASYYCYNRSSSKSWRNQATGYAVLDGVGYLGINTSGSVGLYCY